MELSKAAKAIYDNKRLALWLHTGFGKTRVTLEALNELLADGEVFRVVIIAPLRVARNTWEQELGQVVFPHVKMTVCCGSEKYRREQLTRSTPNVFVINVDNVAWMVDNELWDFDCVVIDESTKFKSPSTARFKMIRRVMLKTERAYLLSGTPRPQGVENLWSQIYLLDGGKRLETSYYKFRLKYFHRISRFKYAPLPGAEDQILANVADICYTEENPEVNKIPSTRIIHNLRMPAGTRAAYESIRRNFILELESSDVTAVNKAVSINKLLQICSGFIYGQHKEDERFTELLRTNKMTYLKYLLEEDLKGRNVLIAYVFEEERYQLLDALPQAEHLSDDNIARWNAGKIPVMLLHPRGAAHGLNLQYGGNVLVWYGLTWSLEDHNQAIARITRRGQKADKTEIHYLLTRGTVEEYVYERLWHRDQAQSGFMDDILTYLKHGGAIKDVAHLQHEAVTDALRMLGFEKVGY